MMFLLFSTQLIPWLQEAEEPDFTVFFICLSVVLLAWLVLFFAGLWKMFVKAGKPGWASLIPLYNAVVLLNIIGRPWWYLIFAFIPGANVVLWVIVAFGVSRSFGQNILFALGMIFLFPLLMPVLGFGKAVYVGPMGPSYR
jgi:hypothetical protein